MCLHITVDVFQVVDDERKVSSQNELRHVTNQVT